MERLVVEWGKRLRHRHECAVICLQGKRGPLVGELETEGVSVFDFGRSPRDPRFVVSLARRLRSLEPEIVHTQCAWSLPQQALSAKLGGARAFVLTIHSTYRSAGPLARRRRLFGLSLSRRWIDAIVGVSRAASSWSEEWLGLRPGAVMTIPNGVDVHRFSVVDRNTKKLNVLPHLSSEVPILLAVGSLTEHKDHTTLLRAIAHLRGRGVDLACLISGGGPMLNTLQALAAELGIQEKVHFLGVRDDIPDLMAAADVLVHSSTREGFGLVVAEAQAAGLPVVATDVGGVGEIVRDCVSGYLVEPEDPEQMADAIFKLVIDQEAATRMGMLGKRWVEESYSIDRCAARYEELYQKVLGSEE